ncbi:MAG: TetM/TetW/TetO/TetS family tetracycline resistance ribosomal protection protein [Firmicutes bacterium]|nr:TetM/TetW/TetO/TetS family tetracycline resistance ribosomal protection protein [Bacillota bacterium]MBQ5414618.1 TetM/TetW/TetO/TetS family tetracycline resistance ribosomal protection protein [Bacillota bacterium]
MRHISLALLAHVDAGKTTTAEGLLYKSGAIRSVGRVDHGDAFLDTHFIERERGITVFSKTAELELPATDGSSGEPVRLQLLDTPGHADLAAEAEKVLFAADYALLIISGPDGVQAHTLTLWQLLARYRVPVMVWINKMDICERSREDILEELRTQLSPGFADLKAMGFDGRGIAGPGAEELALLSEDALDELLKTDRLSAKTVRRLIRKRKIFPCCFGSALKLQGVEELLESFSECMEEPARGKEFGARVYKISRDEQGVRLTWVKLTGGSLKVRDLLGTEKVTQIRKYSGRRFAAADEIKAGEIAALAGPENTYTGQGLGTERDLKDALLKPVLSYRMEFTDGTDPRSAYQKMKRLSEEDPQLAVGWDERAGEVTAEFMGRVQVEVLESLIEERFGYKVKIGRGRIKYLETIASPVEGMGHYEPLRHYAEVHLLMEPLPAGSGLIYETALSTDELDANWQHQVLGSLASKEHIGVLTGAPLTDVKMTLVAGRSHPKHTEGGDFREAALRAVRSGLMKAENVLLEPFYSFRAGNIPPDQIGRAINDLRAMRAEMDAPQQTGETMSISGEGPVLGLDDYLNTFLSYTRGRGQLSLRFCGYRPCRDPDRVIEEAGYDPLRDTDNPSDSVFCSHGSGISVPWDKAEELMHLDSGLKIGAGDEPSVQLGPQAVRSRVPDYDDKELEAIMLREFGPIKRPRYSEPVYNRAEKKRPAQAKQTYLMVDGYNMIYAWEDLKDLAETDIAAARERLSDLLQSYSSLRDCSVVLVFDAYRRPGGQGSVRQEGLFRVVYTREGESADAYMERLAREIGSNFNIRLASSDGMIQLSALRNGMLRESAAELELEIKAMSAEITEFLDEQRRSTAFSNTPRQV